MKKFLLLMLAGLLAADPAHAADAAAPNDSCSGFTVGAIQANAGALYKCTTTGGSDKWLPMPLYHGESSVTCNATNKSLQRYNYTSHVMEYCNGTAWTRLSAAPTTPSLTASATHGYFVVTTTKWDGNLGGRSGADAKCLTELGTTYTSWLGYTDANSRSLITAAKVKAWLCDSVLCSNLMPWTTYYFAVAGSSTIGGGYFTTDHVGNGPGDLVIWSAMNYFGGNYQYWTNRVSGGTTAFGATAANAASSASCSQWSVNTVGVGGYTGFNANNAALRWGSGTSLNKTCNNTHHLICMVNP